MSTLIADIGGSNTRLAVTGPDGRPSRVATIADDSVSGLEATIAAYLDRIAERPDRAVLAVAGPVAGRVIAMTNRDWRFDLDRLEQRFGFSRVHALNDFEALAWALPLFGVADVRPLGPAIAAEAGPKAALGPGTGLGVAALVPVAGGWCAVASEGGHVSFGPALADEWPVFERFAKRGVVSAEMVVSGPGLERLYRAMYPARAPLAAGAIDAAARAGDAAAGAAVRLFVRLLGRFAGNMALTFRATGGVYVAGGVAMKLGALIDTAVFRRAFEDHPPHQELLVAIPTYLVTCAEPGLLGCAAFAAQWRPAAKA